MMKPTCIVVRRTRTKDQTPILFFYSGPELTCYAHMGQHSSASLRYLQGFTRLANPADPDCAALIREWDSLGPAEYRTPFVIVKRLYKESQP